MTINHNIFVVINPNEPPYTLNNTVIAMARKKAKELTIAQRKEAESTKKEKLKN